MTAALLSKPDADLTYITFLKKQEEKSKKRLISGRFCGVIALEKTFIFWSSRALGFVTNSLRLIDPLPPEKKTLKLYHRRERNHSIKVRLFRPFKNEFHLIYKIYHHKSNVYENFLRPTAMKETETKMIDWLPFLSEWKWEEKRKIGTVTSAASRRLCAPTFHSTICTTFPACAHAFQDCVSLSLVIQIEREEEKRGNYH